ncbi:DUF4238 domain-containing protein [Colwellia sp. Bg11-28]|uniref:DUF4238 domain-containing protein n=1 Tax=Colwellia sp. Bg11-28 TaxID=2058305 RepID=UPI000C31F0C5|nr:DUF4238 domain-containing protein [Colwellia sp. Bg11-28]PKH88266.1 hypothetical protein CXF79_05750 [Colwellia sp. Bg11-28]
MGRKAKHHYIPKCYLKGFTNEGENSSQFWAVPTNNNSPFTTSPNDSCAERDYYSVDHTNSLIIEDFYAEQIEPKIIKAIRHIESHACLPPKEEMRHLILLLATLYIRVPSHRKTLEIPLKRTKEIVASMSQEINVSNKDEFEYSKTDLVTSELRLIDTVQECLSNKYYQLHIIEDDELNVVTSDNPFILSHPKGGSGFDFGLNTSNIEICVPITSKAILIATNEEMKEGSFVASKELIGLTNTKLILSTRRFFYSKTEEILLVDDDISVYKHNISTHKSNHLNRVNAVGI